MATGGSEGFDEAGRVKRCEAIVASDHSNGTDDPRSDSSENERATMASKHFFGFNVVNVSIFQSVRENFLFSRSADDPTPSQNPSKVESDDEGRPVLREHWKPRGLLSVGRSRLGFPDCEHDHLVQLLVCKNQHTRETIDIADHYDVTVAVSYDGEGGASLQLPDYQCKRIKSKTKSGTDASSMIGVIGYLFRFHEPLTKYKIKFGLEAIPPKLRRERKRSLKEDTACETICQISVTLETGPMMSSKSDKTKKKAKESTVFPLFALSPPSLSKESTLVYKRSWWVFSQLRPYRASGKWEDFEKLASDLSLKFTDADTQIAIKLEQSLRADYQNQPDRALELIDEAFNFVCEAKNPQFMAARGYIYQAQILRRQGRLGKAEYCVSQAGQNIAACQTSLETIFTAFGRTSILIEFIACTPHRSLKQVNEARNILEKCIDVCLHLETEKSSLLTMKQPFVIVLLVMTKLLLDCDSDVARQRNVSKDFIAKAEWCLDMLRNKYWSEMTLLDRFSFYLGISDLEYRRRNYAEAEELACLAKDKAVELGLNREASKAQERLDFMRVIPRGHTIDIGPQQSESEGEKADISSSGAESDWLAAIFS